jgi:N-acetylglutamate synthase-like GNAT family acetyltransferase
MDMKDSLDMTPRLGCVYVPPEYRGKSIASVLCKKIELELVELGFEKAYLCTDTAVDLYTRLGWKTLSVERHSGRSITTMYIDLK